jgi:hypothetical protein
LTNGPETNPPKRRSCAPQLPSDCAHDAVAPTAPRVNVASSRQQRKLLANLLRARLPPILVVGSIPQIEQQLINLPTLRCFTRERTLNLFGPRVEEIMETSKWPGKHQKSSKYRLAWKSTCTSAPSSSKPSSQRGSRSLAVCANKPHCQIWSRLVTANTSNFCRSRNRFDPFFRLAERSLPAPSCFLTPDRMRSSPPPPDGHASTTWVAQTSVVASLL